MVIIYSVFKDKEEAQTIIRGLLEAKMIICGNMFPVDSLYLWKGKIESDQEVSVIMKARKSNYKAITEYIVSKHSYEAPCIAQIKVNQINPSYYYALKKETIKCYGKKKTNNNEGECK